MLKVAWRRVARLVNAVPVRLPGLLLLVAAALVAFRFSREQADYLLYPAGLAAIGLVVLCALGVALAAALLRREVRRRPAGLPDSFETTVATRTAFRFPRLARWPLVEVAMRWEQPAGFAVALDADGPDYAETVTALERGRHARLARRFTVEDVFGLCAVSFAVAWDVPFRVAPLAATAAAELAASYAHGDAFSHPSGRAEGDLVEMRAYAYGDPLRHVLWKTFARTRRLLVRMPERAIAPKPITVAFMVAGERDEPTAAAARLYLERGVLGPDFIFAADGSDRPVRAPAAALEQIIDSIKARKQGGAALEGLANQVEPARLTTCIVFAPPVDGPWRERLVAFTRRLAAPATVIIGVEGAPANGKSGALRRLLVRVDEPSDHVLDRLPALRAALEAEGLRVQVLHRETGQML